MIYNLWYIRLSSHCYLHIIQFSILLQNTLILINFFIIIRTIYWHLGLLKLSSGTTERVIENEEKVEEPTRREIFEIMEEIRKQ